MFHKITRYALAGFSLFSIAAYADPLVFSTITVPGSSSGEALGINNAGEIVGYYLNGGPFQGYLLNGGTFSAIDVPGSTGTIPFSINGAGDIVGTFFDGGGTEHGFLLSGGVYSSFDPAGSIQTQGWDINNSGQIVGEYVDGSGDSHGFLLSGGVYTTIDFPSSQGGVGGDFAEGINDAGQISGSYCTLSQCLGFLYDGTNYSSLAIGPSIVEAFDINNLGQIGGVTGEPASEQGFILSNGIVSTVDFPGSPSSFVRRLNDVGDAVGTYTNSSGVVHGFLATPTTSAVPEPGTSALLGSALAMLGLWRLRRRSRS